MRPIYDLTVGRAERLYYYFDVHYLTGIEGAPADRPV